MDKAKQHPAFTGADMVRMSPPGQMPNCDPRFGVGGYEPRQPKLRFRRLPHGAGLALPAPARLGDAGLDLRSAIDMTVAPGGTGLVPTGFALAIPAGYVGLVMPRSGLAIQFGITLANSVGVIDSGFRGELKVALKNGGGSDFEVRREMRIAQLLVMPFAIFENVEVDALDETERGSGGFGSTGG